MNRMSMLVNLSIVWSCEHLFIFILQTAESDQLKLSDTVHYFVIWLCSCLNLKPMYSFGKWWKLKMSPMGFVYRVVWVLKALWIVLSETINILRKLHKTRIFGMPPKILP